MENTLGSQDWGEIAKAVEVVHAGQARVEKAYYDALGRGKSHVEDLLEDLQIVRRETAKAIPAIMRSSSADEARRIASEFRRIFN